jgi:hypothetical protein
MGNDGAEGDDAARAVIVLPEVQPRYGACLSHLIYVISLVLTFLGLNDSSFAPRFFCCLLLCF